MKVIFLYILIIFISCTDKGPEPEAVKIRAFSKAGKYEVSVVSSKVEKYDYEDKVEGLNNYNRSIVVDEKDMGSVWAYLKAVGSDSISLEVSYRGSVKEIHYKSNGGEVSIFVNFGELLE